MCEQMRWFCFSIGFLFQTNLFNGMRWIGATKSEYHTNAIQSKFGVISTQSCHYLPCFSMPNEIIGIEPPLDATPFILVIWVSIEFIFLHSIRLHWQVSKKKPASFQFLDKIVTESKPTHLQTDRHHNLPHSSPCWNIHFSQLWFNLSTQ